MVPFLVTFILPPNPDFIRIAIIRHWMSQKRILQTTVNKDEYINDLLNCAIQYNTIQYLKKTYKAPYVTKKLFVGAIVLSPVTLSGLWRLFYVLQTASSSVSQKHYIMYDVSYNGRRSYVTWCEQLVLLWYRPKVLLYDAERNLLAIAKFLVCRHLQSFVVIT